MLLEFNLKLWGNSNMESIYFWSLFLHLDYRHAHAECAWACKHDVVDAKSLRCWMSTRSQENWHKTKHTRKQNKTDRLATLHLRLQLQHNQSSNLKFLAATCRCMPLWGRCWPLCSVHLISQRWSITRLHSELDLIRGLVLRACASFGLLTAPTQWWAKLVYWCS